MEEHFAKSFNMFLKKSNQHSENVKTLKRHLPSVVQRIMYSFDIKRGSQFNILSVGSGSGEIDIEIVNIIQCESQNHQQLSHIGIFNRAIEPNQCLCKAYTENIAKLDDGFSTTYEIKQQTFREYQESKDEGASFDIIHFIHSLYYVNIEQTVLYCLKTQLAEKGYLICLTTDDESLNSRVKKKVGELSCTKMCPVDQLSQYSEQLIRTAEKCGWKYEIHSAELFIDLTEVFIADSIDGNLLLDFLTNVENFRKSVNKHVLEETLAFIKQLAIVKDGKCFGEKNESLVFIYK
jgi:histamine N-methyltransferase